MTMVTYGIAAIKLMLKPFSNVFLQCSVNFDHVTYFDAKNER